jgi:hypothetical protein
MTSQGPLLVAAAGIIIGTNAWPAKVLRKFKFEHWWFVAMLVALVIIPWTGTLALCNDPIGAYRSVPASVLLKANLCSLAWGIANVLCGVCLYRVGVALSGSIITGLGVVAGVTLPMLVKGSGLFKDAPDIGSRAGLTIMAGVAVMLMGVVCVSVAGYGRDKVLKSEGKKSGGFVVSLLLCIIAGITSSGMSLCFVYGQGPIVSAMKARGASDVAAELAVWAGAIASGALLNLIYPAFLITKRRSWDVLVRHWGETLLAALTGTQLILGVLLMGRGMVLLGALGASVGFGIQQAAQMMGSQGLGFASGEWRGVHGAPLKLMIIAIGVLVVAAAIMAYGNTL